MDAESRRPSDRDAALARLRTWRVAIAVAGAVGVAAVGTVAAETIPGRADSGSTGAAQSPDPGSSDQQQPQVDGGGFQQPFGAPRSGFGRGQAVTGGS